MEDKLKGVPLAAMERLLRKEGAERVSDKAKMAMKEVLEEYASKISLQAIEYCEHAGRKTIKAEDIKLAQKVRD